MKSSTCITIDTDILNKLNNLRITKGIKTSTLINGLLKDYFK
jgi:hypothetical protein